MISLSLGIIGTSTSPFTIPLFGDALGLKEGDFVGTLLGLSDGDEVVGLEVGCRS